MASDKLKNHCLRYITIVFTTFLIVFLDMTCSFHSLILQCICIHNLIFKLPRSQTNTKPLEYIYTLNRTN